MCLLLGGKFMFYNYLSQFLLFEEARFFGEKIPQLERHMFDACRRFKHG